MLYYNGFIKINFHRGGFTMINAKDVKKIMQGSNYNREEIKVTISIYKAVLDSKSNCRIDFWISNHTANLLRENGYSIIYSDKCTFISW